MKLRSHIITYLIITASIILACCNKNNGEYSVIEDLNNRIIKLPCNKPLEFSDCFIGNLFDWSNYDIIGLGEATHGTKNFFELKQRLFEYLVEHQGFKVLAYEFSFRTSLKVDDYVVNGIGRLDSLFAGELWIQDNEEVLDLVKWMREYNKQKSDDEKIHFVGIDNQLDAFHPEKTIECIERYFPEIIRSNKTLISRIEELEHIKYKQITAYEYERRKELFTNLKNASEYYFDENNQLKGSLNYKLTMHLIESLLKSNHWLHNIYTGKNNNRDSDLADNSIWVRNTYKSKVAIWAHNAHVQNNPHYYKDGGASMGKYLRDTLGDSYLIVSTSFSKGKFEAVMEAPDGRDTPPMNCEIYQEPPQGSVNEIFNKAKYRNFFLDINNIGYKNPLHIYLDTLRPMLGIGDFYAGFPDPHYTEERVTNIIKSTDVIFYFTDTEPIHLNRN